MKEYQFDELNKNIRKLNQTLCCSNSYNKVGHEVLNDTETKSFSKKSIHSVSWSLATGATMSLSIDGATAVTYAVDGAIEFSTLNEQSLLFTAIGADVTLIWNY